MTWLDVEAFGECRTMTGHRWRKTPACAMDRNELYMEHACTACGTLRHTWYNAWTGDTTARWYEYPDGYCEKRRRPKNEMRALYIRKFYAARRRKERA